MEVSVQSLDSLFATHHEVAYTLEDRHSIEERETLGLPLIRNITLRCLSRLSQNFIRIRVGWKPKAIILAARH